MPAPTPARTSRRTFEQDYVGRYLQHPRLAEAARYLLRHGRPPTWIAGPLDLARLLFDLCTLAPGRIPEILKGLQDEPAALFRLSQALPFGALLDAMRSATAGRHTEIALVEQLHAMLAALSVPGTGAQQRQAVLFRLVLDHWLRGDWPALAPEALATAVTWRLMRELELDAATLRQAMAPKLQAAPARLRDALQNALSGNAAPAPQAKAARPQLKPPPKPARRPDALEERAAVPMHINNAGLVLLQEWFKRLFTKLELVDGDRFVSHTAQRRAVHYLQFLATGQEETPEQYLLLNKLLCGLDWHAPVEAGITITAQEKALCESLLQSAIGYWSAIGDSSVDGFRGNWLVRGGSLSKGSERWNLVVKKRAYDLLVARSPFTYSVIKLPWMDKAVHVTWPAA